MIYAFMEELLHKRPGESCYFDSCLFISPPFFSIWLQIDYRMMTGPTSQASNPFFPALTFSHFGNFWTVLLYSLCCMLGSRINNDNDMNFSLKLSIFITIINVTFSKVIFLN